jgi:hypothetical protein
MYTAGHEPEGQEGLRARHRQAEEKEGGGPEDTYRKPSGAPEAATPAEAAKDTLRSLRQLATTLGGSTKDFLAYFRLDAVLLTLVGGLTLVWFSRHLLSLVLGRVLLPALFGKSYAESKSAYHEWMSAAIDRLIPPPGIDEGRAGEGIINTLTGGKQKWWKPQIGFVAIRALRWTVKRVLGV